MNENILLAVSVIVEEASRSVTAEEVQKILFYQWNWYYSEAYIRKHLHIAAKEGLINEYRPNNRDWKFYGIYTTMEDAFRLND